MEAVRPGLHDLVGGATAGMTVCRVGIEGLNLDFLHRVLRRAVSQAAIPGRIRRAIQQYFASLFWRASDAPCRCSGVIERVYQRWIPSRDDTHGQLSQHNESPTTE